MQNCQILPFLPMLKYLNKYARIVLLLIVCFVCSHESKSQNMEMDLSYLYKRDSINAIRETPAKSDISKKINPISVILNGSLKMYQKVISPQFSANCLYELSCSRFSQSAIQEYGVIKGLALTADRLARCNRISATTINPFRVNQQGKVIDSPKMYKIAQ